jgi:predicted transcriptional regulator of viral defense system
MTLSVMLANRPTFGDLPDALISQGVHTATTAEIAELTGANADAVRHGLSRLRQQQRVFSPARGLYVMVPPEYRSWGVVPGSWFIDALMGHLGRDYYVGLLTAAAHHGAAHQAPQVFQSVVDRHVEDRDIERVRLRFYRSALVSRIPVDRTNTYTGTMPVSTREATVVDLVERPNKGGGLSNVATILREIGDLDADELARLSALHPRAHARRLGWLLANFRDDIDTEPLQHVADPAHGEPVALAAASPRRGPVDPDWNLIPNIPVEPDV